MLNSGNQTNICALLLPHTHTHKYIYMYIYYMVCVCVDWKIKCAGFKRALGLHIHKHIEETDIGIIGFVFLPFSLSLSFSLSISHSHLSCFLSATIPALFTHHYYINFRILLFTLMNLFKFHEIFNSYLLLLCLFSLFLCFFLFYFCSCECSRFYFLVFRFGILSIWYLFMWVFAQRTRNTQISFDILRYSALVWGMYAISRKNSRLKLYMIYELRRCLSNLLSGVTCLRRRIKRRVTNCQADNAIYVLDICLIYLYVCICYW